MKNKINTQNFPTSYELKAELKREKYTIQYKRILKSTVCTLIVISAISVLIATLILPVLKISGTSMEPTLNNGDIVILAKVKDLNYGDLCAFSYSNKILIKRIVGISGDYIEIDEDGNVYVNNQLVNEPYIFEKGLGECDIEFPYQVPDNQYFLLGDHRLTSIDSRSSVIGCVSNEQIIGKIVIRVWPLSKISLIE